MNEILGQIVHPYGYECDVIVTGKWPNGLHRIDLVDADDGSPVGQAGKNVDEPYTLAHVKRNPDIDYVVIKDYAEMQGVYGRLLTAGLIETTNLVIPSGWVNMPLCTIVWPEEDRS